MKLTDTQLLLLSAASQRDDRALEPPPKPTGGAAASCERAGGTSEIVMTKIAMTMSVLMRPDRDIAANYRVFFPLH